MVLTTYQRHSGPWTLTCGQELGFLTFTVYVPDFDAGEIHKAKKVCKSDVILFQGEIC